MFNWFVEKVSMSADFFNLLTLGDKGMPVWVLLLVFAGVFILKKLSEWSRRDKQV